MEREKTVDYLFFLKTAASPGPMLRVPALFSQVDQKTYNQTLLFYKL
jgi:hypothetical protein